MKVAAIFLIACFIALAGCQSVESQKRLFVDLKNAEIGRPFYAHEKPGMKEVQISDTLSEFVPEVVPSDRAVVVWTVDTTSRGPYHHPNGTTFQIEGMKKSWSLLGDPELARTKINWWGPW
ncbi:MAG: hypothetical protein WA004_18525 [Saprospiraceae bacterium]